MEFSNLAEVVSDSLPNYLFTAEVSQDSIVKYFGFGKIIAQGILEGDDWAIYPTDVEYESFGFTYSFPKPEGNVNHEDYNFVYSFEFNSKTDLKLLCGIKPGLSTKAEVIESFGEPNEIKYGAETYRSYYKSISFTYESNSDTVNSIFIDFKN